MNLRSYVTSEPALPAPRGHKTSKREARPRACTATWSLALGSKMAACANTTSCAALLVAKPMSKLSVWRRPSCQAVTQGGWPSLFMLEAMSTVPTVTKKQQTNRQRSSKHQRFTT